ncbi:hypothetical protein QU481_17200 [Crenobacter sp. SG2303]|uniref:Uncharacterized protein n=1 Tax=Crenobacter oryzisoli TaxID=3056844 RepID=A0ABT7XS23_9NEIS|nr:hypothetical protein [Crenobacter sp. SG2303]MDN0076606.1 hypothetical protein [Crenobacter sp. SG2303]
MLVELPIDRSKEGFAGIGGDQALLEEPDRGAVRNLAAVTQADETLKAQAVEQVELHLFIAEVEQLLNQQDPYHQFGRERRAPATLAARARGGTVDLGGQDGKVDMLLQGMQHIPELVEFGFSLLSGKQAVLDDARTLR